MTKLKDEKGSAILFAVVAMAVMVIFSGIIALAAEQGSEMTTRQNMEEKAKYIAEAGLEKAISELNKNRNFTCTNIATAFEGGRYVLTVVKNGDGTNTVTSRGEYPAINPQDTRELVVKLKRSDGLNYAMIADEDGDGDGKAINIETTGLVVLILAINQDIKVNGMVQGNAGVTMQEHLVGLGPTLGTPEVSVNVGATNKNNIDINNLPASKKISRTVEFPRFDFETAKRYAIADGSYYANPNNFRAFLLGLPPTKRLVFFDGDLSILAVDLLGLVLTTNRTLVVNGDLTLLGDYGNSLIGSGSLIAKGDINYLGGLTTGLNMHGTLFSQTGKIDAHFANMQVNGFVGAKQGINIEGSIIQSVLGLLTGDLSFTYDPNFQDLLPPGAQFIGYTPIEWVER